MLGALLSGSAVPQKDPWELLVPVLTMRPALHHAAQGPLDSLNCPFSQPIGLWVVGGRLPVVDQAVLQKPLEFPLELPTLVCHHLST